MRPGSPVRLLLPFHFLLLSLICGCGSDPAAFPPPARGVDAEVETLLSRMTLEEKIGQMTLVDQAYLLEPDHVRSFALGALLSGGDSAPPGDTNTARAWADMYDRYQSLALESRLGIPLLYGVDAVHGHNNVTGAVVFPHNIGLGCTGSPALVEEAARVTAAEVLGTGIGWTFAPCVAVPRDERWGRTYEGYGETPELAQRMGSAAVRGFQARTPVHPGGVLACAKHYAADGGTEGGADRGDARISEEELRRIHLPGYVAAIRAGVGTVMASYSSWNGRKMHENRYLLTDVLKGELGFDGFVVSDWAAIDELPGDYSSRIEAALNAGVDMIMLPAGYLIFIPAATALVRAGRVPLERVDDAVRRILRKKMRMGLFEAPLTDRSLTGAVGSPEHREIARRCVRRSLVVLKNEGPILPLSPNLRRVHVSGWNADDLGNQCGGWTITWQGMSGAITEGTTVLEAVRKAVSPATEVTFSLNGAGSAGADVAIVVLGEGPYAEGAGDRNDLSVSPRDRLIVARVRSYGVPIVAVLISGRPLIVEPILEVCDALVAAWLPGTEGEGVTDVLFGAYPPTGRLSHTWPRNMSQVPINVGDDPYDPLFPFGHGLTYEADRSEGQAGPDPNERLRGILRGG